MKHYWTRRIILGMIFVAVLVVFLYPHLPMRVGGEGADGMRLLRDAGELSTYYTRSLWVLEDFVPYRDNFIEYPQATALYLAWPLVFVKDFDSYQLLLVLGNALLYILFIVITGAFMRVLKRPLHLLWLFALPASLYFALYRFDVVPALVVMASLFLLYRQRHAWALALIGLAIFLKWYALVLLPLYWWWMKERDGRVQLTIKRFLILGVVIAACVGLFLWWFGFGFVRTYQAHLIARSAEAGTIFVLVDQRTTFAEALRSVLLFLQITPALLWIFVGKYFQRGLKSFHALLLWSAFSIMCFAFFAKFYSPQWVLWFVPLLLLLPLSRRFIWLLVLYDMLNFLQFPVVFDGFGPGHPLMIAVATVRTVVFAVLLSMVGKAMLLEHTFQERSKTQSNATDG